MQEELDRARSVGLATAMGGALGAAGGAITGHMGIWVAGGIITYIALTIVGGFWKSKSNDPRRTTNN